MKRIYSHIVLFLAAVLLAGCWVDHAPDNCFVPDFRMMLSYGDYGSGKPFSDALDVLMTNTTEQYSYEFRSDLQGAVDVRGIMPGQYTVNVSGSLDGKPLAGFMGELILTLDREPSELSLSLFAVSTSPVIFKELYYAGSSTPSGGTYRNDNFYSIVNNTAEPVDLGNYYIGMTENYGGLGETGPLWPGETPGRYGSVYLRSVWKIVDGDATYVLQPGATAVIATMAAAHNQDASFNPGSPVDLSSADFEAYVPDPENRYPDFDARNMKMAFWPSYAYLWRSGVFGQGMVLIEATAAEFDAFERVTLPETFQDPFEDDEYWICLKVPNAYVADAVDLIQNEMVTNTKHFPPEVDAGYATVGKIYSGLSVIRKVLSDHGGRKTYQDTNNSTVDFIVNLNPLSE